MHIQESGEMYLESIHVLLQKKSAVRSVDISEYMGYSKPSVSRAVGLLKSASFQSMIRSTVLDVLRSPEGQEIIAQAVRKELRK